MHGKAVRKSELQMHPKETNETLGAMNPMQETPRTFETTWRAKWLADGAKTIEQMAEGLEKEAAHLRELAAAGVELADEVNDDYASLTTTDPDVAAKYEFQTVEDEDEEGN